MHFVWSVGDAYFGMVKRRPMGTDAAAASAVSASPTALSTMPGCDRDRAPAVSGASSAHARV